MLHVRRILSAISAAPSRQGSINKGNTVTRIRVMIHNYTATPGSGQMMLVAFVLVASLAIVRLSEAFTSTPLVPPRAAAAATARDRASSEVFPKAAHGERPFASLSSSSTSSASSPSSFPAAASASAARRPQRRTTPPGSSIPGGVKSSPSGVGGDGRGAGGSSSLRSRRAKAAGSVTSRSPSLGTKLGEEAENRALKNLQGNLKRFAGLRMWRQALTAFKKARDDGVPLNGATYTQAINVMSKGGRWKEALELLEEMIAEGGRAGAGARRSRPDRGVVAPSVVSYNAAISACARGRKPELALELLGDMRERSGIPPDLYSYAAALSGLAKAGRSTRALQLLDEMRGAGTAPDSVCLVAAMEACATRGSWREAGAVLEQVREMEPSPTPSMLTGTLTSAITSCIAEGAWERAIEYLEDIRAANAKANVGVVAAAAVPPPAAYAAAAEACARAGQGIRARGLIAELEAAAVSTGDSGGVTRGEGPTIECYNALIAGFAIAGDLDSALRTLREEIPRSGLKVDTRSYNHLLAGCARAGRWETALELLGEQRSVKSRDAPANRESYNSVLDACGRSGQVAKALDLLGAMRSTSLSNRRLRPDRYSYRGALEACRAAGDFSTALRLLRTMGEEGVRADQACSLAAVAACAAAGRGKEAAGVLQEMVAARVSTSDGARALARDACTEEEEGGGGNDGAVIVARKGFERALVALDALDALASERSASTNGAS